MKKEAADEAAYTDNAGVWVDNINNVLYVTDAGSKKIERYDLSTLKSIDPIILDEAPKDTLRLYIDGNENIALLNSKSMPRFKVLDLNTRNVRCEVDVEPNDVGFVDVKNKQFIRNSTGRLIPYGYDCRPRDPVGQDSLIVSRVSEDGVIGLLRADDLKVDLMDLASGRVLDSFSIANGNPAMPRHNMFLNKDWFAAHFDREPGVDVVFYNRKSKETSWVHLEGTLAKALMKQVYLVDDRFYVGMKEGGKYAIAVIDLKNKMALDPIVVSGDVLAYAPDLKGDKVFLLNRSGKISKKNALPVPGRNKDALMKPLDFGVMLHLEGRGQLVIPDEEAYRGINRDLKEIIDLFTRYNAKITIESEMPYVEAAEKWGDNMLAYALRQGHGVGTHCDFDSMDQEGAAANYRSRKERVDALVGAQNNLGCSGGWGTHDWAKAADQAGFSYLDAPVMIAYLAVPEENRPVNPDTGRHFTDAEIAPGSRQYYHDPIPPAIEDRIYPRRLKDTQDLSGDETGVVLIPGSLGEIASLDEGRKNCFPRCRLTQDDIDRIFEGIDHVNGIKDGARVPSLYLHFPINTISLPPFRKGENLKIIEDWLERMQEYQRQGQIKWRTMKEIYEEYRSAARPVS